MKNIIFAESRTKGLECFDKLIGEIPYKNICKVRKSNFDAYAELTDGTTYKVVVASDSSRGYKCDRAYVDTNIEKSFVINVICPCLFMSNLSNDEQIMYF